MRSARRHITLIELLIAMGLVTMLITALLSFYGQFTFIHLEVDKARKESFAGRYVQSRLAYALPRAIAETPPKKENEKKRDFYFFSSQQENELLRAPSLVFTFDNGMDLDPLFSNHVLGRLFLEESGGGRRRLCLAMWPVPRCWKQDEDPPMKKEVLLEEVKEMAFRFYQPPQSEKEQAKVVQGQPLAEETPEPEANQWHERWLMAYRRLPAVVEVRVKTGQEDDWTTFAFPLPNAKTRIVIP